MPVQVVREATFRFSHCIGRRENIGPGFSNPADIACGPDERLYIINRAEDDRPDAIRITIFNAREDYIGEFGRGRPERGEKPSPDGMAWATSIALDHSGNVYVGDEWLSMIFMFTGDGDWIGRWGVAGHGDGELDRPAGLAFDSEDNLFVTDSRNNRIQKFTKDGEFLAKWGREGTGDGEFNMPWGIDTDTQDNVYVVDWRNDRIQKFTPDGQFLMKFGSSGSGDGQFNRPAGIAVDKEGIIYVTDWGNDRLQIFDTDGQFLTKFTGDATLSNLAKLKLDSNPDTWKEREISQYLEREKLFWRPRGLDVDDKGRVFVLDSTRSRIQVYRKLIPTFYGLYDGPRL